MKELFEKMMVAWRNHPNTLATNWTIEHFAEVCCKVATEHYEPQLEKWGEECATLRKEAASAKEAYHDQLKVERQEITRLKAECNKAKESESSAVTELVSANDQIKRLTASKDLPAIQAVVASELGIRVGQAVASYTPSDVARDQEARIDKLKERITELENEKDKEWCELKGKTIREATEKIHKLEEENETLKALAKKNFKIEWPAPSQLELTGENITLALTAAGLQAELIGAQQIIKAKEAEIEGLKKVCDERSEQIEAEIQACNTNAEELGRAQNKLGEAQKEGLRLLAEQERLRDEIRTCARQDLLKEKSFQNVRSLLAETQEARDRLNVKLYRTEDALRILAELLARTPMS